MTAEENIEDPHGMWFLERMGGFNKNAGYLVETKTGRMGRTYHDKPLINGKMQVFCAGDVKLLCTPETLKQIGFID